MLLGVLAVFVLPIVVAYWFAILHPQVTTRPLLNHGVLLDPPIAVATDPATQSLAQIPLGVSEWGLLYVAAGSCAERCAKAVTQLVTVRQLVGKEGTRVHVIAVVDSAPQALPDARTITDPVAREFISRAVGDHLPQAREQAIVFFDWRGFIMLAFAADASPADIKADLQRLLRASAIH